MRNTLDGFAHQRLDAYHVAQELATRCVRLTAAMPRGFADLRDQARRSALATVRHIAEGASRTSPADKRARFVVARGEVAELDATLETAQHLDLLDADETHQLRRLADRVGAMLTGLVRREGRRARGERVSVGVATRRLDAGAIRPKACRRPAGP